MPEIKCPNCGEVFQIDESGYAQIVQQVRDSELEKEIARREREIEERFKNENRVSQIQQEKEAADRMADKERLIQQLNAQLAEGETKQKLAVSEAVQDKDRELAERATEITELRAQLAQWETEKKLAVSEAVQGKDRELSEKETKILELEGQLTSREAQYQLHEQSLKEQHAIALRLKDEQIEQYKDFKARQSTKMVGESLEQHCLNQFNAYRMGAFPRAYFEKDNDASSGSKGDFIFREASVEGVEFISIMFEMKNEMDTTATKHKNEDFFKELDRDRREKNCEYAVLVSLLESDNELYNTGIVDVSYRYPKMYVVRPQFFIPIITLLRNAALNSLQYRQELQVIRDQQIDVVHFEENMTAFKEAFGRNYRLASEKFQTAIEEIDKSIDHLEKIKKALLSSENNLRLANDKAEDLTIKKLTKNAPSVREMFDRLEDEGK